MPIKASSESNRDIMVKNGKKCPSGYYASGDAYCKQINSDSSREAIPRSSNGECPTGWYRSGDYCKKI